MRILFFSRDYTTHDHRFLSALAKTEHQVYYLRLEQRGHALEDRPLPPEVEIVSWKGGTSQASFKHGASLWQDLRRVIRNIQPEVIQAGPIQRSAFLAALTGFHPLISMSWGYDLLMDAEINGWWRWATRYTLKRSDLLIGDCDTIRKLAVSYGMHPERIITFPWGIDIQRFSPGTEHADSLSQAEQPFTLLSTRSWEPIYGVDVIARAFVQAAAECSQLRMVMLGNGSQAGLLRQIFDRGGVEERVYFPGQVSQADLPRYYRNADLYVSASHSDGTSISLLEAMACGKPVLVADIPGNLEWVTPEANGWIFPDGNAEAMAQAILQAVEQRAHITEMGRAARLLAEKRANWKENFKHMLEAYQLVTDQQR
jgi:glycosyltransferase involved in cell wall biosynthesis